MPPWENFSSKYYRVFRICILFSSITVAPRWAQRLAYIQMPTLSLLHAHLRRVRGGNGVRPSASNLIFIRLVFAGNCVLQVVPDFSRVKYRIGEHLKTLDRSVPEGKVRPRTKTLGSFGNFQSSFPVKTDPNERTAVLSVQ